MAHSQAAREQGQGGRLSKGRQREQRGREGARERDRNDSSNECEEEDILRERHRGNQREATRERECVRERGVSERDHERMEEDKARKRGNERDRQHE